MGMMPQMLTIIYGFRENSKVVMKFTQEIHVFHWNQRASMLAHSPARPPPTTITGSVMAQASGLGCSDAILSPWKNIGYDCDLMVI